MLFSRGNAIGLDHAYVLGSDDTHECDIPLHCPLIPEETMISLSALRKRLSLFIFVLFSVITLHVSPVAADGEDPGGNDPTPGKIPVSIWWINHMVGISITFQQ